MENIIVDNKIDSIYSVTILFETMLYHTSTSETQVLPNLPVYINKSE